MKNTETKFPQYIDGRIFFQDINLAQTQIMKQYYLLLNSNNYSKASEFLNNSEVFFYGAWLLNLFEKRLHAIYDYVSNLPPKKPLVEYQTTEPVPTDSGVHWISSDMDINSDDDMGTWETVSNYTWEQLFDYTWEDINTLKEHINGK